MIRRIVGNRFLLFAQNDHALLAGQLAEHLGNQRFAAPEPRSAVLRAIALHDAGWPEHDREPTLNDDGFPLDFLETPPLLGFEVWGIGFERCANEDPYTRLLISLHLLSLSAYIANSVRTPHERFELNKFQHRQIEHQEALRRQLGLATDIPLKLGLAVDGGIAAEEQLKRNFHLLQLMDRLSLALLCNEMMFRKVEQLVLRPGNAPATLNFTRTGPTEVRVEPWPFEPPALASEVPCRVVPVRRYSSIEEFRQVYSEAPMERFAVTVRS